MLRSCLWRSLAVVLALLFLIQQLHRTQLASQRTNFSTHASTTQSIEIALSRHTQIQSALHGAERVRSLKRSQKVFHAALDPAFAGFVRAIFNNDRLFLFASPCSLGVIQNTFPGS